MLPASLLLLWVPFIWQLAAQWSAFEQYNYGFLVPFACAYLLWCRPVASCAPLTTQTPNTGSPKHSSTAPPKESPAGPRKHHSTETPKYGPLLCLLFLLLPLRVIHEANPFWRVTTWAWALIASAITLLVLTSTCRSVLLRRALPVLVLFLTAIPWPTPIEAPVTQGLMRANAGLTVELLGLFNIPAFPSGNVIHLATGPVGIEEACGGIRSFQVSLMLSVFFGELYRLAISGRLLLCLFGAAVAFIGNVFRTTLLSGIAAHRGINAIEKWHDPASIAILVLVFTSVWLVARGTVFRCFGVSVFQPDPSPKANEPVAETPSSHRNTGTTETPSSHRNTGTTETPSSHRNTGTTEALKHRSSIETPASGISVFPYFSVSVFRSLTGQRGTKALSFLLIGYVLISEIATHVWYRLQESHLPRAVPLAIQMPRQNPGFCESPLPLRSTRLLRCDLGTKATWTDSEGNRWLLNYLRWNPGKTATHLARLHTPEACLPAAGQGVQPLPGIRRLGRLEPPLPFRAFRIGDNSTQVGYVFYCRSGDRRDSETEEDEKPDRWQRFRSVFKGRGNQGMTVLELAVWGIRDEHQAQTEVEKELGKMLRSQTADDRQQHSHHGN